MSSDPTVATTAPANGGPSEGGAMPATMGRYRVMRRLGAGGMGVVYAGHDPQLDRPVAIKVLHASGGHREHLAERLHREARALAKVTHPNVVSVYDVGVDGGEVYVVMQYVAGQTLDHVLAARRHARDEVLALFAAAGRGLIAAHAADLVHRDFKPTNVLVDGDGTVRVSDFGLARLSDLAEAATSSSDDLAASLTRGDLVGTPAYMAPEQFRRGPITAATDQFSFCVALWEALCEQRPFAGDSVDTIRDAVLAGVVRVPSPAHRLPARLDRILRRGLAVDPAARFPSMAALLEALAPRRTRTLALAAGATVLAAGGAFALWPAAASDDPCRGADRAIAGVWGPAARDHVRAALASVAHPSAAQIADATVSRLDERAERWRGARIDTCTAHRVRRTEPAEVEERRIRCLDEALAVHREIADYLGEAHDVLTLVRALDLSARGTDPSQCTAADTVGLTFAVGSPSPARDELVEQCRRSAIADETERAIALCTPLATVTGAIGDHARAAQSWLYVAKAWRRLERYAWARKASQHAAEQATAAGSDGMAVDAWSHAASDAAASGALDDVDALLAGARGAAARSQSPLSQIMLDTTVGFLALENRRIDEALSVCERAVATAERMEGADSRWTYEPLGCIADAQERSGDLTAALATRRRSLAVSEHVWGSENPATLSSRHFIALSLATLGQLDEARTIWDEVTRAYERIYGADSVAVMNLLVDRAQAESPGGETSTESARAAIARAVTIGEARLAPGDPQLARVYQVQAWVLYPLGDHAGAAVAYQKAIAILEHTNDPADLMETLFNYGDLEKERGHCAEAIAIFARAADLAEANGQATIAAYSRYGQGACLGRTGKANEGEALLMRSIAELDANEAPIYAAQARWELGSQQWSRGKTSEGVAVARRASAQLAEVEGEVAATLRTQIDAWIAHPK